MKSAVVLLVLLIAVPACADLLSPNECDLTPTGRSNSAPFPELAILPQLSGGLPKPGHGMLRVVHADLQAREVAERDARLLGQPRRRRSRFSVVSILPVLMLPLGKYVKVLFTKPPLRRLDALQRREEQRPDRRVPRSARLVGRCQRRHPSGRHRWLHLPACRTDGSGAHQASQHSSDFVRGRARRTIAPALIRLFEATKSDERLGNSQQPLPDELRVGEEDPDFATGEISNEAGPFDGARV